MSELQTFHGQVVDLRRNVNVHLNHLRPFTPADRYELWLRAPDGGERKFSVDTREMPARRGHRLSLVTSAGSKPQVLGLINLSAAARVNYARTDPLGLTRHGDGLWRVWC